MDLGSGRGPEGQTERSLGAENTSPQPGSSPAWLPVVWPWSGDRPPPGLEPAQRPPLGKVRGADAGADLTPGYPSSSASLGGSLLLGSRTSPGVPGVRGGN